MKAVVAIAAAAILASAATLPAFEAAGQQAGQQTQPKPEPKPEEKAPATVAGKWNLWVETPQGGMASVLDLKQDGKKITGMLTGQQGEMAVDGEFADQKITFSLSINGPNGAIQVGFTGVLKPDGTMAGTLDFGQGPFNWSAERPKG